MKEEEELLLWLDIAKKLDIAVVFGSDHFRVGHGSLGMMTYNAKRRWVFPLVPTACAFDKLGDYFSANAKNRENRGRFYKRREISGAIWKFGK